MEGDCSIDWDMEEREFFGYRPSSEKMFFASQKHCNVGKKLLITGLAISSAPVVLPPLVIMSAFGLAASIPYGVFLASYACTETFMSVWLPIPPPPELEWEDDQMVDENGYQEDIDEDEEEHVLDMTKRGEILDDFDMDVVVVQGDKEGKTDIGRGYQEAAIEVTNVEFDENGDIEDDEEEQLKETRGLLARIRDEGRRENDFTEANGVVDYVQELEISEETDKPSDWVEESVAVLGLLNEAGSAAVHPHTQDVTSEAAVSSKAAKPEEPKLGSITIIDVIESAEDLSVSAMTIGPKIEANAAQNEVLSSEVKIKENIDSMKKIVGYEATPLGTYIDEVNALYAFVGVEPPSPMKGSSAHDLNLLNQKLQFLMSIVGVK